jgi:methylisocitrate lyase
MSFPGKRFRLALKQEKPLQIVGAIHAYAAILAQAAGFRALYLSGAGVANASRGIPDLGMTTLEDVLTDLRRITHVTDLPVLVDADTGWGGRKMIAKTVREMTRSGAAALHLEDQVATKRCGHRPNKRVVPVNMMVDRVKAAVDARTDHSFVVMARTDAVAVEGMEAAIERSCRYVEAGADMLFAEALYDLDQYRRFIKAVKVPVLANITEFGKTPLYTRQQLGKAGVSMILYPLSAFRAMNAAALKVYTTLRSAGTQKKVVPLMQTRKELYKFLDYERYEKLVDRKLKK